MASGWPILGQDGAVAGLRRQLALGRPRHAYLLAGPDGIGKTALARAFAAALCCQQPPAPDLACGTCVACQKIARGVHPDVQTFSLDTRAALADKTSGKNTSLTVDTVRELRASTALRPMEGRWRVIIIDDAELLLDVAQEALLKTLEEPPSFVVLILLSNHAEILLPTIRSRCELVELRPVTASVIIDALSADGVDRDRATDIAALAAGRIGWARRAATDPKLLQRRREAVDRALAWMRGSDYERLVTAVRLGDTFSKRRLEVFADLDLVLGLWRDAMLLRANQSHYLTYRGDAERLDAVARGWQMADVHRALNAVSTCVADLEANVRPRLAMEAMVLRWPTSPESSQRGT